MPDFSWINEEEELTSEALTVRAQAMDPDDVGRVTFQEFFPREDVDSTELHEITEIDFRPVGSRREWNQGGRKIPLKTPDLRNIEMVPIESEFVIGEKEIQKLAERTLGNQEAFRDIVRPRIPQRSDDLVEANFRRLDIEAYEAWADGQITVTDPETDASYTVSLGFDAARYQTASTAWDDGSVNAYQEFLAFLRDSRDKVGPIAGVILRQKTLLAIQDDAPNPMPGAQSGLEPTLAQLEQRVEDELATPFRFAVQEESHDVFDDAGKDTTRTKVWPAQHVAVIPDGTQVGSTATAPVARAMEIARAVPEARIDVRGQTVYHNAGSAGKQLEVQAQVNAMPIPNEQRVSVIDAGV